MDLMKLGTQLVMSKLGGGNTSSDMISSVRGSVLSGGSSEGGLGAAPMSTGGALLLKGVATGEPVADEVPDGEGWGTARAEET